MQQKYSEALEKQREEFEKKVTRARREQDEVFIQKEPTAIDEKGREVELRQKLKREQLEQEEQLRADSQK